MITVGKRRIESQKKEVSEALRQVSAAIEAVEADFNEVCDDDLLEAMIYERSALRARYSYLLKELKKLDGNMP